MGPASGAGPDGLPAPPVPLRRGLTPGTYALDALAPGLVDRAIVRRYAAPVPHARLKAHAQVQVTRDDSWPRVHERRGVIQLPQHYLRSTEGLVLYLDLVHELVHVRQFLEGKALYHRDMEYVDWPTEIEAYRFTVEEARALGLADEWIREYLAVPWADALQMERLCRACGL